MSTPAPRSSRRRTPDRSGLVRSFLDLGAAQQRTAAAALVVLISLGTPWYSTEVAFPAAQGRPASVVQGTMSGISAFSFVEAAVLLVAGAVLVLVWGRATGRSFSLPAGDGTVVTGAAGWLGVLIVYRLFDRPEGGTEGATATLVGLSWGIFATLAAVGLLLATGLDQRRRDAERRAAAPDVPDGPVVDPADVVPVTGSEVGDRRGRRGAATPPASGDGSPVGDGGSPASADRPPAGDGPGTAGTDAGGRSPDGRPTWDGPRGDAPQAPQASPTRPAWSGADAPGGRTDGVGPRSRSWSFDDPDSPEPTPPRSEPSRRRPVPPEAPTQALGRDAAAAGLRDAGRDAARPGDDEPTRVAGAGRPSGAAPAHVVSWDGADDPTRALPAHDGHGDGRDASADRDATDATRIHDLPPTGRTGDERPRRGLRRRRDGS